MRAPRAILLPLALLVASSPAAAQPGPPAKVAARPAPVHLNAPASAEGTADEPAPATVVGPKVAAPSGSAGGPFALTAEDLRSFKGAALLGLITLAPAAVLMFTSFVRINIVLILVRQALGSPQVPGNQVLAALALLLSALVMKPVADTVYERAIRPYNEQGMSLARAWEAGSAPVKVFMVRQIERTGHVDYLWDMYEFAEPAHPGRIEPAYPADFPLRAVAPAFLLSELTTALMIGFVIYLPFLVIDLVVSAVLSAMGLFMLPPSLVALPLKLVLFVLADGWLLVATALLRTFAT